MKELSTGIKGHIEKTVTEKMTAAVMGSGSLNVYATPAMTALMEETSYKSILEYLEEGMGSVGTKLEISHQSATPVGMKVWCDSELVEIDRKRLVFHVTAYDECGVIGEGIHERFLIENEKFQAKTNAKK